MIDKDVDCTSKLIILDLISVANETVVLMLCDLQTLYMASSASISLMSGASPRDSEIIQQKAALLKS